MRTPLYPYEPLYKYEGRPRAQPLPHPPLSTRGQRVGSNFAASCGEWFRGASGLSFFCLLAPDRAPFPPYRRWLTGGRVVVG